MKAHSVLQFCFVRGITLILGFAGVAGCNRDDDRVMVYRIPKETQPNSLSQSTAPTEADAAPAKVRWTAPTSWEEQPASGFRKGSYLVKATDGKTADVSVITFPQAAGGVLANVNRWRNQLKLAPISSEAEVGAPISVDGRDLFVVDLTSDQSNAQDGSKTRILGGIFPLPGETWFFKMMGPDRLVESHRDEFKNFLQSVQVSGVANAALPVGQGSTSTNGGGNTNAPTPPQIEPAQGAPLQYTLPPNWREKPLSPMRLASFKAITPNGKETDVSVVSLPAIAGGDLANVNRWRGQLNLGPIEENTLAQTAEHITANGRDYLVVDLVSDAPMSEKQEKQRILAAILDEGGRAWFIKVMGEDQAVESQKSAFTDFLQSLKIPGGE